MHTEARTVSALRAPIAILGVPFDNVTTADTLRLINQMVVSRQPHYLVTANVDFVVQARSDLELRRILFDAHLVVADGMPLVWASRWLGNPLPERVTGSGLTPLLLAEAAAKGWRVFILGGAEQSVAQAAANTRAKHPDLQLVGAYSPPFKPLLEMDHADILRRIREARPDILLVAFGCPKQEKWLNMHYRQAGVPVAIGVGATIDFLAGTMKRAPAWMQKTGSEWIFRLLQEPRRLFRRYVTDLWVFGWAILSQLRELRARRGRRTEATSAEITRAAEAGTLMVKLPPRLDAAALESSYLAWQELPAKSDVLLDVGLLEFIDSTGIGTLIRLQKVMREAGRQLLLVAPNRVLSRALELMKLSDFFSQAPDLPAALGLLASRRRECNVVVDLTRAGVGQPLLWQGEITAANADAVEEATLPSLANAVASLTIDLSAVRFVDSSGVGLMVRFRKQAHRQNTHLRYIGASENLRGVMRILRLEEYLLGPKS
jgi:N-acetylglucosaminyldiphosphoundecaprenol N-acetyl-beta-D-mannosaminyltransferase